jgi:hypothetical protein
MSPDAKRELAEAITETVRIHEASWTDAAGYELAWYDAAGKACTDRDLIPLVSAMLRSKCTDFILWAARHFDNGVER